jgi:hypothetical protein
MLRNRKSRALLGFLFFCVKTVAGEDRMGLVHQARKGLPQSPNRRGCVRGIYPLKRIIHTPKKALEKRGLMWN